MRVDYLHKVYGIPQDKIDLLVMGGDESIIKYDNRDLIKNEICSYHNIPTSNFLIVTGGKIDMNKNIHLLMKAVSDLKNVTLIIFGPVLHDAEKVIEKYKDNRNIYTIGWIESQKAYDYFLAADLVVFPGTHSVLWEQAVASGVPCVFKYWDGMDHVDVGGNCKFLYQDDSDEICEVLNNIIQNKSEYTAMKNVALSKGINTFSYKEIAKRAIEHVSF